MGRGSGEPDRARLVVDAAAVLTEVVASTARPPVFLYDGDCAFCSSSARWLQRRIPGPITIVPWQWVDLGPIGVSQAEVEAAVVLVDVRLDRTHGPEAIAAVACASTAGPWRAVGALARTRLVLAAAWPLYRWVARNRHRLPGGTPQCAMAARDRATRP